MRRRISFALVMLVTFALCGSAMAAEITFQPFEVDVGQGAADSPIVGNEWLPFGIEMFGSGMTVYSTTDPFPLPDNVNGVFWDVGGGMDYVFTTDVTALEVSWWSPGGSGLTLNTYNSGGGLISSVVIPPGPTTGIELFGGAIRRLEVIAGTASLCIANLKFDPVGGVVCGDGAVDAPETCDPPGSSVCDCCTPHGTPFCDDPECSASICANDPFCCDVQWDQACVNQALLDPLCGNCCEKTCRDDCTYCGDGIVNGAAPTQLILNGDFETGAFPPWTTFFLGGLGSFIIAPPGVPAPSSGFPTAPNPGGGARYALGDMNGPETLALAQTFTVPLDARSVILSFEMFVDDWNSGGAIIDPIGLDHTGPPNQHSRVDLMLPGFPPFHTGGGVVANYYLGVDPGPTPNPYTPYVIDITADVVPGSTYTLRFASTLNQFFLHQGVDNVSIVASSNLEECDDGNFEDGDGCERCTETGGGVCEGQPASTPCPDIDGNDCTLAGCDGLGNCDQNHIFTPESQPCDPGVPFDPECAQPGCDGLGTCDPLHLVAPFSEPCTDIDGNECTLAGCDGLGFCDQGHILPDSTPCGDGALDSECALAGCNGQGECDPSHIPQPASTPCTDVDGNECTEAGCDGLGSCDQSHILPESNPCGDGALDSECALAGCNGQGECDPLHIPVDASTPCLDVDGNGCTLAGCDGVGFCDQHHILPNSNPCPDVDGLECTAAGCDGAGNCDQQHVVAPNSTPCTDPDPNDCVIAGCDAVANCDPAHLFEPIGTPCDGGTCDGAGNCIPSGGEPCKTTLYGTAYQGNNGPTTLYFIDSTSGAPIPIGPVNFNSVGAIDFHPVTGVLYGVGKRPADGAPVLITINPVTGNGTEVGPLVNVGNSQMDISFRHADNVLHLTSFSPINPCISLFRIDLTTGLATEIGDTTTCAPGNALAYEWNDTLYHLNQDFAPFGPQGTEHTVNDVTGVSTPLNPLTYVGFPPLNNPRANAMDFDPDSAVPYVSVNDGQGGNGPNYLATMDELSGIVTFVGPTIQGLDGLAWQVDCDDGDPCTQDICKHCGDEPRQPPWDVLTVDCTPFVSPGATSFGNSNTMGMSLQQVDPGGVLFNVTEVTPQAFRALTADQLAAFNLIAINNHPDRISDNCLAGSPGLGTTWHSVIGVNSGGRVHLNSHDLARFKIIIPPFGTPFGAAGGPCPGCEPFAAENLLLQAASWAAGGSQTGLLIFNDSARFGTVGGVGWDNPELNLPPAWGIIDSDQTGGNPTDGGHSDILPGFAAHPIYAGINDFRLQPNSLASFGANIADGSYHSVFAAFNPAIFTITEVINNAAVIDVGGFNAAFGVGAGNTVNGPDGLAISLIRDEEASADCPGDCELYGAAHVGGPGSPSTLYQINPANGAAAPIGPIGFNRVGGLDFHPGTGVLYGIGEDAANIPTLITINPATGAGVPVGPLVNTPVGQGHMDLSFDAAGNLYMTAFGLIGPCISLYQINTVTGMATEIGDTTTCNPGNALGFTNSGSLHHANSNAGGTVYTTNPGTGQSGPPLAPLAYAGFPPLNSPRPNAMDNDPCSRVIYASINDGGGGAGPNYLATLDPNTGAVNFIGQTVNGLDALAWREVSQHSVCCHIPEPDTDNDGLCDPIDPCPNHPNPGGGPAPFLDTVFALDKATWIWANPTTFVYVRGPFINHIDIRPYPFTLFAGGAGNSLVDPTLPPASGDGLWYLWRPDCPFATWTSGGPGECALGIGLPGCVPGERDGNLP